MLRFPGGFREYKRCGRQGVESEGPVIAPFIAFPPLTSRAFGSDQQPAKAG